MNYQYFKKNLVFFNKEYESKIDCLTDLAKQLEKLNYAQDYKKVFTLAMTREAQFSTNIGNMIAIPHIRDNVMNEPVIVYAKIKAINWDDSKAKISNVFFICMNEKSGSESHMDVIQGLSKLFLNEKFLHGLNLIQNYESLIELILNNQEKEIEQQKTNYYDLVAVTACPTGVAHTYLAAEALTKTCNQLNLQVKVETQGTEGSRNTLSQDEINNSKNVILALDRAIDETRFVNHPNVHHCSTRAVIKNCQAEIDQVIAKSQNVNFSKKTKFEAQTNLMSFKNFGRRTYQGVMNGVSYMLPFVIFGGIFIAISFLIDSFSNVPADAEFGKGTIVSRWFNGIGSITFGLIVAMLAGFMSFALIGKGGILPGFVVGMIANGAFTNKELPWLMPTADQLGNVVSQEQIAAGSGFFGAIGGALIVAALYILINNYILEKLPKQMNAIKNILIMPLFGTAIIVTVFFFANIPFQFINIGFGALLNLFSDLPELYPLLGIIMGLMMTSDLGGPINKAAYIFGTITISGAAGGTPSIPMAIAMATGMVPPLAIALSVTFNKQNWTDEQIKLGYSNYLMAASFITEGAIPFTAQQPKKMIIANLTGGAITGILIAFLQVGVSAPHGGIFVAPLYQSALFNDTGTKIGTGITFFLASVLIGAIFEAVIIWALSKYTKFGKNKELEVISNKKS